MAQGNDEMRDIFGRFEQAVRDKMLAKNTALQQLGVMIASLNMQIVVLRVDNEASVESARADNARLLEVCEQQMEQLRKKVKKYTKQRSDGKEKMENVAALSAQEKELADTKQATAVMQKRIEKTARSEVSLPELIEAQVVKIGMVEMENESVRMRNKVMRDENYRLKEKASHTVRDCEQQQKDTALFKPKMLDIVDTMVVEYRKIMQQIALLDEKQKRILLEKSAIIEHMQQTHTRRERRQTTPQRRLPAALHHRVLSLNTPCEIRDVCILCLIL